MKIGIDVGAKYPDIRKIVLKHFQVPGVHPDDLVQEVVLGILERNKQACAFDPARGAFSTYVFQVASNVAARLAGKEAKQQQITNALREEIRPAKSSLGGATVEWAAALDGCAIQLSLFGWDPLRITDLPMPIKPPRKTRLKSVSPCQLPLFEAA